MFWIALLISLIIVWLIVKSATAPSLEELDETIAENERLLAEVREAQPLSTSASHQIIADIEFDYRDAMGSDSHRRVEVEAVDREYFQGHCHKADATRTFVIGRVRGKVLDLDTGELQVAKDWAAAARNHPLNDPSLISLGSDDEDDGKPEASGGGIEICFTGFAKADKKRLEELAELLEMVVRQSVTQGLTHLCTGPNAGPKKMEQAAMVGAEIIDEAEFYSLDAGT